MRIVTKPVRCTTRAAIDTVPSAAAANELTSTTKHPSCCCQASSITRSVPGEGPSLSKSGWKQSQAPPEHNNSSGYYLVDADRLRDSYRKRAIAKLRRLRAAGKLKLASKFEYLRSDENWKVFIKNLESTNWVAYIQPPPKETSHAGEVVNYLTRYLTGGPISNHRIVAADRNKVTFMAREGKRVGGQREQIEITLEIEEFVRRWSLHIQPEQLTKSRYFGGWSNQRIASYIAECRELLTEKRGTETIELADDSIEDPAEESVQQVLIACPHCGSDRLELISETPKPSWKELFWRESETCPSWYAARQRESHRAFWTEAYGSDFYDWYLETQVEGAKETAPEPVQLLQMDLFEKRPPSGYLIDSF